MATNTSIDIKSANGTVLLSTSINEGAKGYYSLMQHDYIVLPFKLRVPIDFKIGSYADLRGVFDDALGGKLAKVYYVTEPQNPTYNTSTGAYEYSLRLDAYYWLWNNFIFKYTPESTAGEASWSLTAPLDVQMGVFLRNLKALGFTFNGADYEVSIDETVENKAVAMTYDSVHLLDALFSMGGENAWDCDVWVTENVIHFGRCEHGDAVKMEIGVEASDMTRNESKGTFATRIYAFGSTRNIPENYRENDNPDLTVNGIVQKRLMLPSDTPYIDAYPDMQPFEPVESVVVFDDIYPKRVGTLSDVRTVDRAIEDENGEQTGTFKAYQYRDTGLTFAGEYILEGQELRIVFQSGKLNGLDFGAIFNPNGSDPAEQLWEIEANEDYGRRLPDEVMKPESGDKYILYGFDIKMVSDQYIPEAEQELKKKAQKYIDSTKIDDGTYTVTLRASYVRGDMIGRTYDVGQKVKLVNPAFFGTEGRVSRIIGWEMCLDIPSDNPIYTIGESAQYSRLTEIEDKVDSLTFNGQAYQGTGSGRGVYLITTNDSTPASNSNAYSALRARATFLLKDREDTTNHLLNLLGGIISPFLTSPDFVSGALGTGFTVQRNADGTTYAEFDKIMVRMKAVFQILEILKADVAGGEIVINSGPRMRVTRVERTGNVPAYFADGSAAYFPGGERAYFASSYRLHFLADDGETAVRNLFHVGDLARCQTFDIKAGVYENVSNRFWWRLVTAVGDDWIEVSSTVCAEGSDVPKEGDTVVQMGSDRDTDRQALIVLSAYGQGAPSLTMYQGIDSFSLSGKDVFSVGYDPVKKECFFNNYGRAYIGDRKERYYMRFSPSEGLVLKPKKFLLETGDELSDTLSRIEQDARKISLSVTEVRNGLERTGIDIEEGKVTVTADSFFVNSTAGTPIAVFTVGEDGRPLIKAEYIDADNLYVKHLEGATGSIGSLEISAESTAGNIPGIYYEYDNTVLKMQPRWMSAMPYNVFLLQPSSDSMNVALYLKRRRSNIYDRALYVDGVAEVYGRLGVGRGPDTGFKSGLPALVAEGISVYGQLCLSTKTVGSSQSLGADSSFIIASTGGIELTLPDSDVSDGQIYYILNSYEGSVYNTLYGRIISGGTTIPRTRMESGSLYMAVYLYNRSLWFVKEL